MAIEAAIKKGITAALDELEPGYNIYTESIEQGFTEPAFFIARLDSAHKREFGRRYTRSLLFDVHFFPPQDSLHKQAICDAMAERMYDRLERVAVGDGTCRAHGLRYEVIDGVLHFFMSFDLSLLRQRPAAVLMQTLEEEVGVTDGQTGGSRATV